MGFLPLGTLGGMPILAQQGELKTIHALRGPVLNKADGSVAYEVVVVRYGSTKIVADRLVVFNDQKRGIAEGRVTLVDIDGTADADRIEFSWDKDRSFGRGENVSIRVAGALLRARRADFKPGEWTLTDAEGTTCLRGTPSYLVTSEKIVLRPGKQVVIDHPRVSVLGTYLGELPTQRASLTPVVPGVHLPSPGYKIDRGFGLTWTGGLLMGPDSAFTFNARTFQQRKPAALALFTHSFLPLANATQILAPRTDFSERFNFGYLDSVLVDTPEEESRYLRAQKLSLSGGGQLNGSVADRDRGTRYSKIEAIFEAGGPRGGVGFLGQARLQGIQKNEEGMEPRLALTGSAGLPPLKLGSGFSTIARLDTGLFAGRTAYGWGRATAGISYSPAPWLRLAAAGYVSGDAGTPQFAIDPLFSKNGVLMRADLVFGGLHLSYLAKDDGRRGLYDHEISINQVIGCLEAFFVQREYPNDRRIGLNIRIQPLVDLLKKRGLERSQRAKSAPPRKPAVQ